MIQQAAGPAGRRDAGPLEPSPRMRDYVVLGGVLRSEVEFPELAAATLESADWTLRVRGTAPPALDLVFLGQRRVGTEEYRLWSTPEGFRLHYSYAGCFDISRCGSTVIFYPGEQCRMELVRAIVLGPVLALILETGGFLCLHGSAVAIGDQAVAFLGPKYAGKSTMATALTAAGARLISDDLLAVAPGPPATVRPGVASVRLWNDSAQALRVEDLCSTVFSGVKTTATGFAGRTVDSGELPLAAVYVLKPVRRELASGPVRRARLAGAAATIGLACQAKLPDPLVGLEAAGRRLRVAAALAATAPIWSLETARDFALLPAVVEQVLAWHPAPGSSLLPVSS